MELEPARFFVIHSQFRPMQCEQALSAYSVLIVLIYSVGLSYLVILTQKNCIKQIITSLLYVSHTEKVYAIHLAIVMIATHNGFKLFLKEHSKVKNILFFPYGKKMQYCKVL